MLDLFKINFSASRIGGDKLHEKAKGGWGALLPVIYAVATGLPVILAAWVPAYSVAGVGKFYNRIHAFEK